MAPTDEQHTARDQGRAPLGRNYWRLLTASGLSNLGDGIAIVALPWYAATVTDDPLLVASVGVATRLPWLLFALLAGAIGDRVDRRRLIAFSGSGKVLVLAALSLLVALDTAGIAVVLVVALLVGFCEVFVNNTAQSLLPSVVPRVRLERANGNLWSVEQVANRFVGAPVAGLLVALSMTLTFGIQALLVASAVLVLLTMRGDFHPARTTSGDTAEDLPSLWVMLGEGIRWLWEHRLLRVLAVVLALTNLAASMNAAVLVLYAQDVLGLGSVGYGLLLTTVAVGMVLGAQVVPWLIPRLPPGATLVWVLAAQAVAYTAIALVPSTALFALLWVVVGFTTMWWNILTISLRQRIIPDPLLSRVLSAFRTMGLGTAAIGMALGGLTASLLESPVGRETALSAPFLLAGLISFALAVFSARSMTTARIRAALVEADRGRTDQSGRDEQD